MAGKEELVLADELAKNEEIDGGIEGMKARKFAQDYLAWVQSNNPKAGDDAGTLEDKKTQNLMGLEQLKSQMHQMQSVAKKTAEAISAASESQKQFEKRKTEIRKQLDVHRQNIIALRQETCSQVKLKRERKECEAMLALVTTLPERKNLEARCKQLKDELGAAQKTCDELESEIQLQKNRLDVLMQTCGDIAATKIHRSGLKSDATVAGTDSSVGSNSTKD